MFENRHEGVKTQVNALVLIKVQVGGQWLDVLPIFHAAHLTG
jgi:hypothetical protein